MENITVYFNLLKEVFDELELNDHPECIYNMDQEPMSHPKGGEGASKYTYVGYPICC